MRAFGPRPRRQGPRGRSALAVLAMLAGLLPWAASLTPAAHAASASFTNASPAQVDNGSATRSMPISSNEVVDDVNVTVTFTKACGGNRSGRSAFYYEIGYRLTSPSGTTVNLVGGYTFAYNQPDVTATVTLDDEAASGLGGTPATGTFKPLSPLSAFDDQPAGGTWNLTITDYGDLDALCHASVSMTILTVPTDTTGPTTAITSGPADGTRTATDPTYEFTSTDADLDHYECRVDTGVYTTCTSPAVVATSALSEGTHTFSVRGVDTSDNAGDPDSRTFVRDITGPTTGFTTGPPDQAVLDQLPAYGFASDDADLASFECAVDDGVYAECTSEFTPAVPPGEHRVSVRGIDTTSNRGAAVTRTFTLRDVDCDDATAALAAAQAKVVTKKQAVAEARKKLRRARASGDPTRVRKAKRQLVRSRAKLTRAKSALVAARDDHDRACG